MLDESSDDNMEIDKHIIPEIFNLTDSEEDRSSCSVVISEEDNDLFEDNYSDVDDNSDENHDDSEWLDTDTEPVLHSFVGQEGLRVNLSTDASAWDVFSLIFDNVLVDKIVHWTNARATVLQNTTTFSRYSSMKKWTEVTVEELKRFLGLCIMMGNINMPSLKKYWSTDALYNHPLFGKTMSRDRFEKILRCLCFYEETDNMLHPLHKIDQVLKHLLQNIQNVYYPGENLSLDEAMLLWRGRLSFKQSIPDNKVKYGIKLYELCTPDGFVLNIVIYSGKDTITDESDHASCIVYELMKNYIEKGHTVYMDSFYNSVRLAKSLYKDKTHIAGILRGNRRGNPKLVSETKIKTGESIFNRKGNVLVQKWKDKRDVLTISTKHKATLQEVVSKRGIKKIKPLTVIDYNKYMPGVDRADQMLSYHSTPRKSVHWYLKVFFYLLDVAVWNACWIYNKINAKAMSYLEYRDHIALNLLKPESEISVSEHSCNVNMQHFPQKLNRRIRCRVCAKKKTRTATWYACEICKTKDDEPIGLCIDKCFKIYHKK